MKDALAYPTISSLKNLPGDQVVSGEVKAVGWIEGALPEIHQNRPKHMSTSVFIITVLYGT
jgi:hypothetical protein